MSAVTTTPTATAILVQDWDRESFPITSGGRLRKRSKQNITGSASWSQEMMARMVLQRNPRLLPTAEACEQFMLVPTGWTDLSAAGTASSGSSPQSSVPSSQPASEEETMAIGSETTPEEFDELIAAAAEEREEMMEASETVAQGEIRLSEETHQAIPPPEEPPRAQDEANHKRSQGVKRYWEKRKALSAAHDFGPVVERLGKDREALQAEFDGKMAAAKEEFDLAVARLREEFGKGIAAFDAAMLILEGD